MRRKTPPTRRRLASLTAAVAGLALSSGCIVPIQVSEVTFDGITAPASPTQAVVVEAAPPVIEAVRPNPAALQLPAQVAEIVPLPTVAEDVPVIERLPAPTEPTEFQRAVPKSVESAPSFAPAPAHHNSRFQPRSAMLVTGLTAPLIVPAEPVPQPSAEPFPPQPVAPIPLPTLPPAAIAARPTPPPSPPDVPLPPEAPRAMPFVPATPLPPWQIPVASAIETRQPPAELLPVQPGSTRPLAPRARGPAGREAVAGSQQLKSIREISLDITPPDLVGDDGQRMAAPPNYGAEWFAEVPVRNGDDSFEREYDFIPAPEGMEFCYQPLYFEEVNVERYGRNFGILQPVVSVAHFYSHIPTLPYCVFAQPARRCTYHAHWTLPGYRIPCWERKKPVVSSHGLVAQTAATYGFLLLIP